MISQVPCSCRHAMLSSHEWTLTLCICEPAYSLFLIFVLVIVFYYSKGKVVTITVQKNFIKTMYTYTCISHIFIKY